MDQEKYRLWVGELSQLTTAQLADLSVRMKLLAGSAHKEHDGKSEFGLRVLQAICDTMRKNNVEAASVHVLKNSTAYKTANGKLDDLAAFFNKVSSSRLIQDAVLKTGTDLLYLDLSNWNVAVSSHTMFRQVHRIPAILNHNFPGYSSSGLLAKIVKCE